MLYLSPSTLSFPANNIDSEVGGGGGIYAVKTGSNRKWMKLFMKRAFSTSASTTFVPDCSFGQNWNMFANTVDTVETTELRWRQLYW